MIITKSSLRMNSGVVTSRLGPEFDGRPSGSAMPLVWAHAEHLRLQRSLTADQIFDLPPHTDTRDAGLGIHLVDLTTEALLEGSQGTFTFHWSDANRWEGWNFVVQIAASGANGLAARKTGQPNGK